MFIDSVVRKHGIPKSIIHISGQDILKQFLERAILSYGHYLEKKYNFPSPNRWAN